jgi:hypothetical protein
VDTAVRNWAQNEIKKHPHLLSLGYFGSYARGDWGVGSDLDLVAIVRDSAQPFAKRSLAFDLNALPVPAGMLVYTAKEWKTIMAQAQRFSQVLCREVVWLIRAPELADQGE